MSDFLRWKADYVKNSLKVRRVIVICGARQTGKTTLAKQILSNDSVFRSLDNINLYELAKSDPAGFVQNESGTMVIDEVQKVKQLISEIKYAVDNNNRNGQYLLTGSANLNSLPGVVESMPGRVKNIRLRPLTVGEILYAKPKFLEFAFDNAKFPKQIPDYDKKEIFKLAFRGGYPEAIRLKSSRDAKDWFKDYINLILENDLKDISNVIRKDALKDLIVVLASWSSKFMDIASICSSLGISKPTVTSYINALEALYIFEKVPPWIKTDYERIGRRSKIYASDTGLMTSVLGWKLDEVMLDVDRSGKLMETFVFGELAAQVDLDNIYSLYQYRDREKHEIDFIVEREDGALLGIEVKAGHNVSGDDFKPQRWFKENIIKNKKPYTGFVLYSGDAVVPQKDNMFAVPIAALWLK